MAENRHGEELERSREQSDLHSQGVVDDLKKQLGAMANKLSIAEEKLENQVHFTLWCWPLFLLFDAGPHSC